MKIARITVLAVLLLAASLWPLHAEGPVAPSASAFELFAPMNVSVVAPGPRNGCVLYYCPVYYPNDCSCEWVWCAAQQAYECGASANFASSTDSSCGAPMTPAS